MSKESSSLLSKVVKFVRNPRTDWADLDTAEASRLDAEEELTKQQLRETLERKRQNDFVRRREFEALRKLRNREGDAPQAMHSPSFFPSSDLSDSDGEKQNTLEKIAAIEAQMASQWFNKGQDATLKAVREHRAALAAARESQLRGQTTQPQRLEPADPAPAEAVDPVAFAPTQTLDEPSSAREASPAPTVPASGPVVGAEPKTDEPLIPGDLLLPLGISPAYKSSQFEVAELVNNPEVEEIAILYANGETVAAEEALLRMISPTGSRRDNAESWMALFDLYRATGQHARFDEKGIEFAAVFGRSAPPWYSVPELLAADGSLPVAEEQPTRSSAHWTANSTLTLQNLALLETLPQRVAPPWRLDWRYLKQVEPEAAAKLAQRLDAWSNDAQVKLRFVGADHALKLLEELTPVADTSVNQAYWALRLAMMRILGLMDDFELNALNFCVTYEMSPPSWASPKCECVPIQPDGALDEATVAAVTRALPESNVMTYRDTDLATKDPVQVDDSVARARLAGEVVGDASSQFAALTEIGDQVQTIEVDCRHVQRVDFVAAGTLLNWVSDHQSKGQSIIFSNVNRLVAIFFRIIGIRELATVSVRQE